MSYSCVKEDEFMTDYKELYILMVDASEKAIEAIEKQNFGAAKEILIAAEQECEEIYVSAPQQRQR